MTKQFTSFLALACLGASTLCAQQTSGLTLKQTIILPGVTGKFDHFALDDAGQRLFASSTGTGAVLVIDLASNKIVESLQGLGKPHGLVWIAQTGRLFVADGGKGELDVYGGAPLQRIQSISLSADADDMVYDTATKLLYVGHGGTNAANPSRVAVVDTDSLRLVASLPVASHPEALELDAIGDRIFVNIADSGQVVVIDGKTRRITLTWPLNKGKDNTPLVFDEADGLLLVGCRAPATVTVLNATTGMEGTTMRSDTGADDLFFDPATHHVYLIAGGGAIDSFALSADGKLTSLGATQTVPGAKTGYLDAKNNRLYIGVPGVSGASAVRVYETH